MTAIRPRIGPLPAGALILAVLACAWFAIGARQAHDAGSAQSLLSRPTSVVRADRTRALSLIDGVRFLNPGVDAALLRAQLEVKLGHRAAARRILAGAVKREPRNLKAWLGLAQASGDSPASFLSALEHINQLAPVASRRR